MPTMPATATSEVAGARPSAPHILAVDGHSLGHRAFHALADEPRAPSWLAAGMVRMLAGVWQTGPYDAVVVAFDSSTNRRKQLDPVYKAQREEPPAELVDQLSDARQRLAECGFLVAEEDGAEGDDLLAATADRCVEAGWRCALLSSDRDLLALVSTDVRLLRPRASIAALGIYGPDEVVEEFGVRPDQYTDFAALRGDPSDGLDGVRGVGAKTAARLLRTYGDVAGIYAALCDLPPRLEAQLRAGRSIVERNLLLMAPLPGLVVDVGGAVAAGVDCDAVDAAFVPRGHGSTAGIFRRAVERPALPPLPPPPHEELADQPAPAHAAGTGKRVDVARSAAVVSGVQTALF